MVTAASSFPKLFDHPRYRVIIIEIHGGTAGPPLATGFQVRPTSHCRSHEVAVAPLESTT